MEKLFLGKLAFSVPSHSKVWVAIFKMQQSPLLMKLQHCKMISGLANQVPDFTSFINLLDLTLCCLSLILLHHFLNINFTNPTVDLWTISLLNLVWSGRSNFTRGVSTLAFTNPLKAVLLSSSPRTLLMSTNPTVKECSSICNVWVSAGELDQLTPRRETCLYGKLLPSYPTETS